MTVLLITRSDDNESVSLVLDAIRERGGQAFRFDTDRFPTEALLSIKSYVPPQLIVPLKAQCRC